jgi:hypothetical protein
VDLFLFRTINKNVSLHVSHFYLYQKSVCVALQCSAALMHPSATNNIFFSLTLSQQSKHASDRGCMSVFDHASAKIQFRVSYLGPQLLYFRGELLALLRVLPLGRLFALHDLQEVQVLLLQLLLLQQQLVEAETHKQIGAAQISAGGFN